MRYKSDSAPVPKGDSPSSVWERWEGVSSIITPILISSSSTMPTTTRKAGGSKGILGAHEFYVRVGQKLITYLSAATEEGIAYKLDMQLRPSGKAGPLVSSLDAFREYHKTSSLLWERQALIKARSVAGDPALGKELEK